MLVFSFTSTISTQMVEFSTLCLCTVPMYTLPAGPVLFGAFELDLTMANCDRLRRQILTIRFPQRTRFQVLRMLLEREDKIVTREEIKSSWGLYFGSIVVLPLAK